MGLFDSPSRSCLRFLALASVTLRALVCPPAAAGAAEAVSSAGAAGFAYTSRTWQSDDGLVVEGVRTLGRRWPLLVSSAIGDRPPLRRQRALPMT